MDVNIKPVSGCTEVVLGVLTLGVYPLAAWINQRGWPRSVDEQGLVTRGGTRIAWNDFSRITKVVTNINRGAVRTEHFELAYPRGKVVVAPYRLEQGAQVLDYVLQHLPEQAKTPQQ